MVTNLLILAALIVVAVVVFSIVLSVIDYLFTDADL